MATVAMTGSTGFIGGCVARMLCEQGHAVRALVRRADAGLPARIETVRGDLGDAVALGRLLEGADFVVHCGGLTAAARPRDFHIVNAAGTLRLLDAARKQAWRPRFLLISSLVARAPHLSAYAASKWTAELAVAAYSDALDTLVVRPPAVYGPRDRATLPLIRQFARGVLLAPRGAHRLSLIHVEDLAAALVRLLDRPAWQGAVVEPDDGQPGGYTWPDLQAEASEALGRTVIRVPVPLRLLWPAAWLGGRVSATFGVASHFTTGKLREISHPDWVCRSPLGSVLGDWSAQIPFSAGLPRTIDWYARHGWL